MHSVTSGSANVPEIYASFINVLNRGRVWQCNHAVIFFMRIEVPHPTWSPIFCVHFAFKCRHLHVCYVFSSDDRSVLKVKYVPLAPSQYETLISGFSFRSEAAMPSKGETKKLGFIAADPPPLRTFAFALGPMITTFFSCCV